MHSGSQNAAVPMIDKKQQQKTEGSDWRSAYDTTRAARRSVRDGWSIASVTRSGGLADECVLLAVPPACQIAVVFATYQDSEAANLLVFCMTLIIGQIHTLFKKKNEVIFFNPGSC